VGTFLAHNDLEPDHVVCSPARRAQDTARRVVQAAGASVAVQVERQLYEGDVLLVVRELPEDARRVLLVGHEPDAADLLRTLCGADVHMPTGALALVEAEGPWSIQPAGRSVLRLLVGPRMLGGAPWTTV
jgi:phosphohistidine phosphatase